jgi:hypothetical protein
MARKRALPKFATPPPIPEKRPLQTKRKTAAKKLENPYFPLIQTLLSGIQSRQSTITRVQLVHELYRSLYDSFHQQNGDFHTHLTKFNIDLQKKRSVPLSEWHTIDPETLSSHVKKHGRSPQIYSIQGGNDIPQSHAMYVHLTKYVRDAIGKLEEAGTLSYTENRNHPGKSTITFN